MHLPNKKTHLPNKPMIKGQDPRILSLFLFSDNDSSAGKLSGFSLPFRALFFQNEDFSVLHAELSGLAVGAEEDIHLLALHAGILRHVDGVIPGDLDLAAQLDDLAVHGYGVFGTGLRAGRGLARVAAAVALRAGAVSRQAEGSQADPLAAR